jgi:uncharacterized protein
VAIYKSQEPVLVKIPYNWRKICFLVPLVTSSYRPPLFLKNGHLATILPSIFRKVTEVAYERERLELADGDFLDLEWLQGEGKGCIILSHGLEGSADRHYVKGMAKYFHAKGWDVVAWNCRSCSGEMNRLPRFYHHGATEDLGAVVEAVISRGVYEKIVLGGFSMGGSLSLKYLGEHGPAAPSEIKAAVVFSVPCDLGASVEELAKRKNAFYRKRFLKKLERKIHAKSRMFPSVISAEGFETIRFFPEFDNRYTAPLHGFANSDDFYAKASALRYMAEIDRPTLVVNALNDPFLPQACYPLELAESHRQVYLETPRYGGHVGFSKQGIRDSWMEERAWEFVAEKT